MKQAVRLLALFVLALSSPLAAAAQPVKSLKITVLSTMLADSETLGEWGYSALVEVDGRRILFDTGANPDVVLRNAKALRIDLSNVEDVILTHNHADHTGGLLALRRELMKLNPLAMSRTHVATGVFAPRTKLGKNANGLSPLRSEYEASGGAFVVHDHADEISPGVWLTGPVPRVTDEQNYHPPRPQTGITVTPDGTEDIVPEDMSLVVQTPDGLLVLTGCGHAGIVNIVRFARSFLNNAPVTAVVGGLHIFNADDARIRWTATELKTTGLRWLLAGHCTGIEATRIMRETAGLDRTTAVVSAVGSSFSLAHKISPGIIAR